MSKSGISRANQNRAIRQEAERERLAAGGHIQHVLDMVAKISNLSEELEQNELNRLKVAIETKLKLINKYLPELKATEITAEINDQREPINPQGITPDQLRELFSARRENSTSTDSVH